MNGPDPRNWKATSVPKRAKRIKRSFSSLASACLPACPSFLPFFLSLVRYIALIAERSSYNRRLIYRCLSTIQLVQLIVCRALNWIKNVAHERKPQEEPISMGSSFGNPMTDAFFDRWTVSGDVFRRPRRSWADVSYLLWTGTRKVCSKNGTLNHGSPGPPSGWPILTYAPYDFNSHIRYQFLSGLNDPFGPFSLVCLQNLGTINTGHSKTLAFYTFSLYVDQGLDHWRWFAGANATRTPTWKDTQNFRPWDVEKGWVHSCRPFGRSNE